MQVISVWNRENEAHDFSRVLSVLIATIGVISYPYRISIMENSMSDCMMGDLMFTGSYSKMLREECFYSVSPGRYNPMVEHISSRYFKKTHENLVEIRENKIYYITQLHDTAREVYNMFLNDNITQYERQAEKLSDAFIIATEYKNNITSMRILDDADRVAVILPVNAYKLERFLDDYASLKEKCIYVFVIKNSLDYQESEVIREKFYRIKRRIIFLHLTDELEEAINNGRLMDYVNECYPASRYSTERNLIYEIEKLIEFVFSRGGEIVSGLSAPSSMAAKRLLRR